MMIDLLDNKKIIWNKMHVELYCLIIMWRNQQVTQGGILMIVMVIIIMIALKIVVLIHNSLILLTLSQGHKQGKES